MSKTIERVEVITGRERRRRYSAEEKVRLVEETTRPGMTVSAVARLRVSLQVCSSDGGDEWPKVASKLSGQTMLNAGES